MTTLELKKGREAYDSSNLSLCSPSMRLFTLFHPSVQKLRIGWPGHKLLSFWSSTVVIDHNSSSIQAIGTGLVSLAYISKFVYFRCLALRIGEILLANGVFLH